MNDKKSFRIVAVIITILLFIQACSTPSYIRRLHTPGVMYDKDEFGVQILNPSDVDIIKLHMKDGSLYMMGKFIINEKDSVVAGKAILYDINRNIVKKDSLAVNFRDIVLIESNRSNTNPSLVGMTLITGASLIVTAACLMNPKACFGSCPTFYVSDGEKMILQAEGFSGSVSPVLEGKDIDALYLAKPDCRDLMVNVTNEALETHVIKYAEILAVDKIDDERVFQTEGGMFYRVNNITKPVNCIAPEGDCKGLLSDFDSHERFSLADSSNLAAKEIIELNFCDLSEGKKGFILGFRQTLMTTYLFYQALDYMGNNAGEWLAMLERGEENIKNTIKYPGGFLGGIDVFIVDENDDKIHIGEFFEIGPISKDVKILPININVNKHCKIILEMSKGLWRIDYAALADIGNKVEPIRIKPDYVIKDNKHDEEAMANLTDRSKSLVTMPGDSYLINYRLPVDFANHELFIESRGYYIEWMREEWTKESDPDKLTYMFLDPVNYLKDIAPEFKKAESSLEDSFWRSKYVKP